MYVGHSRRVEIRELHWFLALAESENVTSAAEKMNISQPTLSRALARLERSLEVRLFDRRQNRLRLNRYGEVLRAHAVRAVTEIAAAERRIASLADPEGGVVALGFLHSLGVWLVPRLLREYRATSPATTFELRGRAADTVLDDLRDHRIDVALTGPRPADGDLEWTPLFEEHLVLLVPAGHRLAARRSVPVTELATEDLVSFPSAFGIRQTTERLCARAGVTPRVVFEATELSTVQALVGEGMGVAIVPERSRAADTREGTAAVPLADDGAYRSIGLLCRAGGATAPAARRFAAHVAGSDYAQRA